MKRLYLYGILACALTGSATEAAAQEPSKFDSSYDGAHYRKRMDMFRRLDSWKGGVTFLGNSITEAGPWSELFPGKKLRNRGISGDVTYGVLARIDEVTATQPGRIFLLIGINDLKRGHSPAQVASAYRRIVQRLRSESPKTKIFVQSVLPVNDSMMQASYNKISNALVRSLNEELKQIAAESDCRWVDIHSLFAGADGRLQPALTTDGIHLTTAGYLLWAGQIKKLL